MQSDPSDTTNTMSVDIRLCGNIPRNEIKERFGAPFPMAVRSLTSRSGISAALGLAETNGSSTLPKTICDEGFVNENLSILQNTTNSEKMILGVLIEKQCAQQPPCTQPLLEPPSWAVPARGETRLEVRR